MGAYEDVVSQVDAVSSASRGSVPGAEGTAAADAGGTFATRAARDPGAEAEASSRARDEALRKWLQTQGARLSFVRDDSTGRMIARLTDPETGEVIRQVPPEEMLSLARAIDRYLGLLVDRRS